MGLRPAWTATFLLFARATLAQGVATDEKLIEHLPAAYKVAWQSSSGTSRITEVVPQNETANAWTELITTQIFLGQRQRDTAAFLTQIGEKWLRSCPGSRPEAIQTGRSNGYMVSMLILRCELSPRTGHEENTMLRAISGDDNLYLVQYAFRSSLVGASLSKAVAFMSTVTVCDTYSPQHPCP